MRKISPPWFAAGLRFKCTACGQCCIGPGDRDTVFVNPHEEAAIAALLGLEDAEFRSRYTSIDPTGARVLQARGDACIFLREGRCTVYAARPVQCRTWPFWPENIADPTAWQSVVEICPGAGSGCLHGMKDIQQAVAVLARSDRGEAVPPEEIPDLSAEKRTDENEESAWAAQP